MGLGIMFYILLAISAFTANLTTFLMMRRFSTGVENIADAVNFDYTICAYRLLGVQMSTMVVGLADKLVFVDRFGECAGLLLEGKADAAIMTDLELKMAYSGELIGPDCKGVVPGSTKKCPGEDGVLNEERDCDLQKIDRKSMITLNVAMPVAHHISQKVGWSLVDRKANAILEASKAAFSDMFPTEIDDCRPPQHEPSAIAFTVTNLQGSTAASMLFVMIGWALMLIEKVIRKRKIAALEKQQGRALTEEEIEKFNMEEKRAQMLEGDITSRLQVAVEDCNTMVKTVQKERSSKLSDLQTVVERVAGEVQTKLNTDLAKIAALEPATLALAVVDGGSPTTLALEPAKPFVLRAGDSLDPQNQALQLGDEAKKQQESNRIAWAQVEATVKQEQDATELLWRKVAAERMTTKTEWTDLEDKRRGHSERTAAEQQLRVQGMTAGAPLIGSAAPGVGSPTPDAVGQQDMCNRMNK